MKITRGVIETKLRDFSIPNGECGQKAFEIANTLFDQEITGIVGTRYDSLSAVLAVISKAIKDDKIVIIWLDTGRKDPNNEKYRAIHCFFIFQDNPLQSFTVWPATSGAKFIDDACTKAMIIETIKFTQELGGVELHVVPQ